MAACRPAAEYCDLGTLTSYAAKSIKDPVDEDQFMQLLVLLLDTACGLAALHSNNVVHGDGALSGVRSVACAHACVCLRVCVRCFGAAQHQEQMQRAHSL